MIYLDYAATSLKKPPCVQQAVVKALGSFANSARGAYTSSLDSSRTVFAARQALAALFDFAHPERVCFTHNATEALNIALSGILSPGEHVISTDCEHNSVLRPLYRLQTKGVEVDFVPADRQGNVCLADFQEAMKANTKAIVCTHASNLTGNVFDLKSLAALAHENGAILIADCSQTAGELPISVRDTGMDVLCFTGHKGLMGPQGTGGIVVGKNVDIRPWNVGGTGVQTYNPEQPEQYPVRLEAGTLNAHGIAGLLAAVTFIQNTGVAAIERHVTGLMRRFYEGAREIPGITVYGDFSAPQRAPIVSINAQGMDSDALADILFEEHEICVRAGAHCAPRMHAALGTKEQGAVRFSFGYYTTQEEVDTALAALREIQST